MVSAAGLTQLADQVVARTFVADGAVRAVGVVAAFRRGAPALFAGRARSGNVAVAVIAALGAVSAFLAVTAALRIVRAFRNDGAEIVETGNAGTEGGVDFDTVTGVAALAAFDPGATAANAAAAVYADAAAIGAFALLAFGTGIDAGTAITYFATAAIGAVTTLLANAATAFTLATAVVFAEIRFRLDTLFASCPLALILERTVLKHGARRTGSSLRACAVEARGGDCDANRSPE